LKRNKRKKKRNSYLHLDESTNIITSSFCSWRTFHRTKSDQFTWIDKKQIYACKTYCIRQKDINIKICVGVEIGQCFFHKNIVQHIDDKMLDWVNNVEINLKKRKLSNPWLFLSNNVDTCLIYWMIEKKKKEREKQKNILFQKIVTIRRICSGNYFFSWSCLLEQIFYH
jgi:hypothetical protein